MKSRHVFVMLGVLAVGLLSPMAMAMGDDTTNSYFNTNTPATTGVILEGSQSVQRSVVDTGSGAQVIERTVSSPVVIERTNALPVVIEDRIVKQKHFLGIGIWPLFDFEIL